MPHKRKLLIITISLIIILLLALTLYLLYRPQTTPTIKSPEDIEPAIEQLFEIEKQNIESDLRLVDGSLEIIRIDKLGCEDETTQCWEVTVKYLDPRTRIETGDEQGDPYTMKLQIINNQLINPFTPQENPNE